MKTIKTSMLITIGFFILLLSCNKNDKDLILENKDWVFLDAGKFAFVRFFDAYAAQSPQLPGVATNTGPQVFMYGNGVKLNHSNLGYGAAWPATSVYGAIQAGPTTFHIVMARLNTATPQQPAPNPGDTLHTFNYTTTAGRYYSMFITDTTTMRSVVFDDAPIFPPEGKYRIRFINMTMNPLDTLNLYSRLEGRNIIVNIRHKQNSDFLERTVPAISDTLEVRKGGATVATYFVGSRTAPQSFSPVSKRIYTVVAYGKDGLGSGTTIANKTPIATLITNY